MTDYAGEIAHWDQLATAKRAEVAQLHHASEYANAEIQVLVEEIQREKASLAARLQGGGSPNRPPHTIAMRIANHEAGIAVLEREIARVAAIAKDQMSILQHAEQQAAHFRTLAEGRGA